MPRFRDLDSPKGTGRPALSVESNVQKLHYTTNDYTIVLVKIIKLLMSKIIRYADFLFLVVLIALCGYVAWKAHHYFEQTYRIDAAVVATASTARRSEDFRRSRRGASLAVGEPLKTDQ
jgi:hypothetical protein